MLLQISSGLSLVFGRLEEVIEIRACERLRGTPHRYPFDLPVALLAQFPVPQVIPTPIDLRTQYGASPTPRAPEFLAETQPPWTRSVILGYSRRPADVLIPCCIGPSKHDSLKTAVEPSHRLFSSAHAGLPPSGSYLYSQGQGLPPSKLKRWLA
ncbi:hypothetical protein NMY22_g15659 [Coprinellus aureogranulatus]|nr:hypothetical protein NMY22_g15659 [Coprinellus aureogranulatus]